MSSDSAQEYVSIRRGDLNRLVELLAGGHDHDQRVRDAAAAEAHQGWHNGYTLGHDAGLGARPDAQRFVAGLFAGWEAGCATRRQVARDLLAGQAHPRDRAADREAGG
jgi:hypothetical protein